VTDMVRRHLAISRELDGDGFIYRRGSRKITRRAEISRIEALAIPPAWRDVEISASPSARVLARGVDEAGRIQAIYHPAFRKRQDRAKFDQLTAFGRALPRLRARVDRDLRRRGLSRARVTACVLRIIDLQYFRVGSSRYAKRHGSYGVTTLRAKHVTASPTVVEFDFVGKSGKRQQHRLRDERVARLIRQLIELPGHEVFRFFDEDHVAHRVRSRHVNAYVKRHMGEQFSAKDFRTWGATVSVANALLDAEPDQLDGGASRARALRDAIEAAAERLGNTPAITRSSYVDPRVLDAADRPELLEQVRSARFSTAKYLTREEQRALRLLELLARE